MSGAAGKRETVVDLARFIDKAVNVKLSGGREGAPPAKREGVRREDTSRREGVSQAPLSPARSLSAPVTGSLKGYDQLLNLVLDDATETLRGARRSPLLHTALFAAV